MRYKRRLTLRYLTFIVPERGLLIMREQIWVFVTWIIYHLGSTYLAHTLQMDGTWQPDSCHLNFTSFSCLIYTTFALLDHFRCCHTTLAHDTCSLHLSWNAHVHIIHMSLKLSLKFKLFSAKMSHTEFTMGGRDIYICSYTCCFSACYLKSSWLLYQVRSLILALNE
jgi:hypothetical protein